MLIGKLVEHVWLASAYPHFFLCIAEVSAMHYNSTPYGVDVVVVVVVVLAKLKNGITFERLEIST